MSHNLKPDEIRLLTALCECEDGKGIPVAREWKKVANSLIRKGLAWSLASIFTVVIATDAGRAALASRAGTQEAQPVNLAATCSEDGHNCAAPDLLAALSVLADPAQWTDKKWTDPHTGLFDVVLFARAAISKATAV